MAKDHAQFKLIDISISLDNTKVSLGIDTVSRRQYTIRIKNLVTGEVYNDSIANTTGSATWENDNKTLFYTANNVQTLRSDKIYKHKLGDTVKNDVLIFTEDDNTFGVSVYKTKSKKYIVIASYSTLTTEYQY